MTTELKENLLSNLQKYVDSLVEKHQVPAISLAVLKDNQLHKAASGCLNIETGVTATPDSIFQIGSITKVFTASLVMQLVDAGQVALDRPVKDYLRDFRVADPQATATVTVRQLLNHTSGLMGDFFLDDSHDQGNLIARYVDRCNLLPQIHPPGEFFCYSNAAFAIAGRLVEVVLGMSWSQAVEERIFKPLAMTHAVARPAQVVRYRAAAGHVMDLQKESPENWKLAEASYWTLGLAPAGTVLTMTAADLIQFAKPHLHQGCTASGDIWLSAEAAQQMQQTQITLPPLSSAVEMQAGIGWLKSVVTNSGTLMMGHPGATEGYMAMLQCIPEHGVVVAVLMNASKPGVLDAIVNELMASLLGVDCQEPEQLGDLSLYALDTLALASYTGRFECPDHYFDISLEGDQLVAVLTCLLDPFPPITLYLTPIKKHCFATHTGKTQLGSRQRNLVFLDTKDIAEGGKERSQYVFWNARLSIKVNINKPS